MKSMKFILIFVCLFLTGLSLMLVLAAGATFRPNLTYGDDQYSGTLGAHGSTTDCWYSGEAPYYKTYDTSYLAITPYIDSASPSGWTLYVGYCKTDFSYYNEVERTTPGAGPGCTSFPVYGVYGNAGSTSESWQGDIEWLNKA
jgi:hypothetical protein